MKKFKILILSGSRAEYGLLRTIIKKISADNEMKLYFVLTGTHLSPFHGSTEEEVEKDKLPIYDKIETQLASDSKIGMAKSTAMGILGLSECFKKVSPDILVCLGDRYEVFAGVYAAAIMQIPVAHIHGGELTFGSIDDSIRHSITKFSTLHFSSTEMYKKRIIQMGESKKNVFNVGALAVENIFSMKKISLSNICKKINFKIDNKYFVITIHPPTNQKSSIKSFVNEILESLEYFSNRILIFTYANSDPGGYIINQMCEEFCKKDIKKRIIKKNLGHDLYVNLIRKAELVIGNSSSGVIEAPIVNTPAVNIGDRQEGRYMSDSVVCAKQKKSDILSSIKKALKLTQKVNDHPFGNGNTSSKIIKELKKFVKNYDGNIKKFNDIDF